MKSFSYLNLNNTNSFEGITSIQQLNILYKAIVHDYLEKRITIDDLSELMEDLSVVMQRQQVDWTFKNALHRHLYDATLAGADIEWYRSKDEKEVIKLLEQVISYYKKLS